MRAQAAKCFNDIQEESLKQYVNLIEAFTSSPAFAGNHDNLIRALERTTAKLPDVTCLICERFLDVVGAEATDISKGSAMDAAIISRLLLRVYSQIRDPMIQTRCLNLMDRMMEVGAYGVDEALSLYDR